MAGATRVIKVLFTGDAKGLQQVGAKGQTTFQKINRAAVAASTVVVAAGLAMSKELFGVSRRMEELDQKSSAVFKDQLPTMRKWAQDNKKSFGTSSREVLALAANFADLLIPMGFTTQAAAEMSREVTELAPALARWEGKGRSAAEVQEVLTKAMLGEREGLKSLGISILEADVQTRLLEKGQKNLTGTALQQAKAVATQELIFEKTADAQAAWANGGKAAAEQQGALSSSIQTTKESLAKALTPAFEAGLKIAEKFAGILERNQGAVIVLSGAVLGLAAAVLAINAAVKTAAALQAAWSGAVKTFNAVTSVNFRRQLVRMVATLSPWVAAIGVGIVAFIAWRREQEKAKAQTKELSGEIDIQTGKLTENGRAIRARQLLEDSDVESLLERGVHEETLIAAIDGETGALQRAHDELRIDSPLMNKRIDRVVRERQELERNAAAEAEREIKLGGSTAATEEAAGAEGAFQEQLDETNTAIDDQVDSLDDLIDKMFEAYDDVFNLRDAEEKFEESVDNAKDAIKENGATLDVHTEKGRANRDALDEIASSTQDLIKWQARNSASQEELTTTMEKGRKKFITIAEQMGLTRDEAEDLADKLGLVEDAIDAIPKKKIIEIQAKITGTGADMLFRADGGFIPARQHGGRVLPGRTYLVGEKGPELLTIGSTQSGFVTPNAALGGPTEVTIPIYIGDEVVRVVKHTISADKRSTKRRALAGAGVR